MKIKRTHESTVHTISNVIVAASAVVLYFTILNLDKLWDVLKQGISLLSPFIWGFVFAYILSRPMKHIEDKWLSFMDKYNKPKLKRTVSVISVILIALLVISALVSILIPQLIKSIRQLVDNIPYYSATLEVFAKEWMHRLSISDDVLNSIIQSWDDYFGELVRLISEWAPAVFDFSKRLTISVANAIIGIVIAVYLLFSRERFFAQLKKFLSAVISPEKLNAATELAHSSNQVFSDFITGKLIDSLIIGILCFIGCCILRIPYALLISVIIGVTNVIPFFGPIIGAVPCAFIVLIVDPKKALWFIIFIIALQQFDGNVLGPKILGNTIGMSAFWVMFAILVGGGLFGFIGMFIGVPAFAVIYSLVRGAVEKALKKRGLPVNTEDYASEHHKIPF